MIIQYGTRYRCDTCGAEEEGVTLEPGGTWPFATAPAGWADTSALLRFEDGRPAGHLCQRCQVMPTLGLLAVLNGGELYRPPAAWDEEAAQAVARLLERIRLHLPDPPDPTRI